MQLSAFVSSFFLVLIAATACKKNASQKSPQGEKMFTVTGKLISSETKQPAPFVGVALTQFYTCRDGEPTGGTDSAGNFSLRHGWGADEKSLKLHLVDKTGCYTGNFELLDGLSGGKNIDLGNVYVRF